MRRLVALFMILSSLLAVAQAPRAQATVILAASATGAATPATRSGQAGSALGALKPHSSVARLAFAYAAIDPTSEPAAATQIGSDRARE